MKKIINFKKIDEYYCLFHDCFHRKYRYSSLEKKKVLTTSFEQCKEHAYQLDEVELWKYKFSKSWNRYDLKEVLKKAKNF